MSLIFCCRGCIAPKRYPGCHDHRPEYLTQKAEHEERKAVADEKKRISNGLYDQRSTALTKIMKGRKAYGFQVKGNGTVKTHADRIRAMTDEELAHELALIAGWDRGQYKKAKSIGIDKVMMDWLKQPAEGDAYGKTI